jgi:serine/threonine protein kinase
MVRTVMTRPHTVQDVFDMLGRDRLVEPARLRAFAERHKPADLTAVFERLITDGLLTTFQATEVAGGRGAGLWLGGYRILDRLGKGGMGHVFLAEHAVLGRRVAVKALSDALRADPGARKRFVREARAAAALDHPNIVRVFDVDMASDPPYLVMEYVDGLSLQAAVARAGTFSAGEAASVGMQVADGLSQAAAVGLVHRDIKPANLLVDRRGGVKILDLGIVRFTQDDTHSRTNGGEIILGTLDYLAPEQAEDCSKVDTRADIYALGATLYFLIAGHPPYPVADMRRKLEAKQNQDPPPLDRLRPDVPAEFAAIVSRLMARDPAERYQLPAAAAAVLQQWATPGPDYPGRLFRPSSDSTAHDRRATDHEPSHDPLPETLRIIKPRPRPASEPPIPVGESGSPGTAVEATRAGDSGSNLAPTGEIQIAHEAETQGVCGAALTDEVLALPSDQVELPASLWSTPELASEPAANPEATSASDDTQQHLKPHTQSKGGISLRAIVGLVLAALVVAALIVFAAR